MSGNGEHPLNGCGRIEGPTLFAIDQVMINLSGHPFNLHKGLALNAAKRGWSYVPVLARSVEDDRIIDQLQPVLGLDSVHVRRFANPMVEIGAANHQFALDLTQTLSPRLTARDLCFFAAVTHRNLYGLMTWADSLSFPPRLALVLWSQQCFDPKDAERNREFYRDLLSWVATRKALGHETTVHAFANSHVPVLEAMTDGTVPVRTFPLNGTTWNLLPDDGLSDPAEAANGMAETAVPLLGYLGNSWWPDKGLTQMLGAIARLNQQGVSARYLIQLDLRFAQSQSVQQMRARHGAVLAAANVSVVEGTVDAVTYARMLRRCAAVVLPYGPAYDHQTSGILFEALALGKPIVTRSGSLLAAECRRLGIVQAFFDQWTDEAVTAACCDLLANFAFYRRQSATVASRVRATLSIDRFLDEIGCA